MKRKILKLLEGNGATFTAVVAMLKEPSNAVEKALEDLTNEGLIFSDGKKYLLTADYGIALAKVVTRKEKFAFVSVKGYERDFRMTGKDLTGLIMGDLIYVELNESLSNCRFAGFYKRQEYLIGTLTKKPRKGYYLSCPGLDEAGIKTVFLNDPEEFNGVEGDLVKAKIEDFDEKEISLTMTSLLVKATDLGSDISRIIVSNEAPIEFPEEVKEEAKKCRSKVLVKERDGRKDFRDHLIVTIDGSDALDFDDAVEVKRITNGYEVGVHIADVSHYVKPGTAIDAEAYERGTSIYVADRVVPMLPTELSNGICSLNPDVERLTMSVIMEIDERGNVYRSNFYRGVIKSKARLTYKAVNDLFEGNNSDNLPEDVCDMLRLLQEVSERIRRKRERKGALKLDSTELKFDLDEKGDPINLIKRVQGIGEKVIEDLMIAANVAVAKAFTEKELLTLYRIHENPPSKKVEYLKNFLVRSKLSKNFPSEITPKSLSFWLDGIEEPAQHKIASHMLLRSLAKARYSDDNCGHFGLCEDDYVHFTSPIRRYPDLIVHRLVKEYIIDEHIPHTKELKQYLEVAGDHLSVAERRAQTIEREGDSLETAKYMSKHLGEQFIGHVSSLMPYGMFMELENGVDALLPHNLIDDDVYIFDEGNFRTAGINSRRWFNIGSEIAVRAYQIDFERKEVIVCTEEYYANKEENERMGDGLDIVPNYRAERAYRPSGSTPRADEGYQRRSYSDRPKRDYSSGSSERRSYSDRPKRDYSSSGERRPYQSRDGERSFNRRPSGDKPYGERRSYSDRPKRDYSSDSSERRSYSDRPKRDYSSSGERRPYQSRDGERSFNRRPSGDKPYGERRSYSDRPKRDYGSNSPERRSYSDRPKRDYSNSGEKKPYQSRDGERSFNRRPSGDKPYGERRSYSDRPKRDYGSNSGEKRSYSDRPKRDYASSGEKKPYQSRGGERSKSYSNSSSSYNSGSRGPRKPMTRGNYHGGQGK